MPNDVNQIKSPMTVPDRACWDKAGQLQALIEDGISPETAREVGDRLRSLVGLSANELAAQLYHRLFTTDPREVQHTERLIRELAALPVDTLTAMGLRVGWASVDDATINGLLAMSRTTSRLKTRRRLRREGRLPRFDEQ